MFITNAFSPCHYFELNSICPLAFELLFSFVVTVMLNLEPSVGKVLLGHIICPWFTFQFLSRNRSN